jgi:hypothetical protein
VQIEPGGPLGATGETDEARRDSIFDRHLMLWFAALLSTWDGELPAYRELDEMHNGADK